MGLATRIVARVSNPVVSKYSAKLDELGLTVDINEDIRIVPKDVEVAKSLRATSMLNDGTVGQISVSRIVPDSRLAERCLADLQALRKKLKRKKLGVQAVFTVQVHPDWKGKGLGSILYEIALYNAFDGYGTGSSSALVPLNCAGGGTSGEAERVWQGLAKRHPSVGSVVVFK